MMRKLRPALPVLILLISGALGVPAVFAQARATTKKKPAKAAAARSSSARRAAKNVSAKSAVGSKTASKATVKTTTKKASASKTATRSTNPRASKKSRVRSRRQPGQKAPTTDRINEIQTALAKDGSFAGEPNGKWGDGTVSAMRKFQASHGLNPTGKLDALTLQKLGLGSQTAGVAAPIAPPGATSRLTSSLATSSAATEAARRQ